MSEVVDSIIADLDVRYAKYVAGFDKATAAHDRFTKSVPKIGAMGGFTQAEAQQYAERHTKIGKAAEDSGEKRKRAAKGASDVEKAEAKAASEAVKKAAKEARDAERVAAKAAADAVKAAEREKQVALKATQREQEAAKKASIAKAEAERVAAAASVAAAEREAAARVRLAEVAQRAVDRRTGQVTPATNSSIGATVPRGTSGQRGIPSAALDEPADVAKVAAEKEVNHLLADQAELQSRVASATGKTKDKIREQIAEMRLEAQLRKAGLNDEAILLRLEERRVSIARQQSITGRAKGRASSKDDDSQTLLEKLVETLNGKDSGGDNAGALAGLASVVGVGVGIAVIQSAIDYGKALGDLSDQLGITVVDLQAYQKVARDTGVDTTTLSSAFGQFASNLGKAQQGNAEQGKVFKALGIDIKDFKTAGEALPTVIDRISKLKDPLQRAGIEARFFGEEGRKLDPLLSGGAASVSKLAASLQETGQALSAKEIKELDETGKKLGEVKNQLQVDFARIVSGNADAIIGLANSFGVLAGKITETIGKLQQFGAQQIRNGFISQFAGKDDKEAARQFLLGSEKGRGQLYAENNAAINRNRQQFRILPNDDRLLAAQAPGAPRKTVAQVKREQLAAANKPLLDQRRDIVRGAREAVATVTAPVQAGASNQNLIRNLDTPKPPKGPKGKSAESIAREEEQRTKQFNDQVAQANGDYLRAQQQLAATAGQRADIELQILETAYKARLADIDSNAKRNKLAGSDAALEDARAAELKAAERRAYLADQSVTLQQRDFDAQRDLTAGAQTLLDIQAGLISSQLVIATTAKERRRLSLELLENEKKQEYNRLTGTIGSSAPGSRESLDAEEGLRTLDQRFDGQRQGVLQNTASPLEAYRKSLHDATDDTNEALEGVAVNALGRLEDTVASSIGKVLGLKGAFGDLFGSILTDIAKIELKKGILALIGGDGESGGGSKISGLIKGVGKLLGGRASGGNVVGGGNYLVGEHGPEIVNMPSSGRVYPNGQIPGIASGRSGVALQQTFYIDASGVNPEGYAEGIISHVERRTAAAIRANGDAVLNATPARVQRMTTLGT